VIEEAAVLVIEDDQQRFLPLGAGGQRVVDGEYELLAVLDVRRCVSILSIAVFQLRLVLLKNANLSWWPSV
jgi:hypothetical protein